MVSAQFEADVRKMEADGVTLSVSEAVRLNSLALRIAQNADAAYWVAPPRVGRVREHEFFEPTYQSSRWLARISEWCANEDEYELAQAFSLAHATISGFFARPELNARKGAAEAINKWADTVACTEEEMRFAVLYALTGFDADSDVYAEQSERPEDVERAKALANVTSEMADETEIREAMASGLGLSRDVIETFAHSELADILRRHRAACGEIDMPAAGRKAFADYARTRDAIIRAHKEENGQHVKTPN